MTNSKDLETWQAAMTLVTDCYSTTKTFPRDEQFGLTAQLRRAAVSIPSNVAEGGCRHSDRVYLNHVGIALGSHAELETCLELARRLEYLTAAVFAPLSEACTRTGQLLNGLYRSIEQRV